MTRVAPATLAGLLERGWDVPPIPPDVGAPPAGGGGAGGGGDAAATSPAPGAQGAPPAAQAPTVRATPQPPYATPPAPPPYTPAGGRDGGGAERPRRRRRFLLAALLVGVLIAAGIVVAVVLLAKGGGTKNTFTATGPWRLHVEDNQSGNDVGCTVKLTNITTNTPVTVPGPIYERSAELQIPTTGTFRWTVDSGCLVLAENGPGSTGLPFSQNTSGYTLAFTAPPSGTVTFTVRDFNGGRSCDFATYDPASGQQLDTGEATPGKEAVTLSTGDRRTVYASLDNSCTVILSAGS